MSEYISPVTRRVATTTGHVMIFTADEPKLVPKVCQPEMLALGIMPVDGEVPDALVPKEKQEKVEPVGFDRIDKINAAFVELSAKNDAGDFTATGIPKIAMVSHKAGFEVSGKELRDRWKSYKAFPHAE